MYKRKRAGNTITRKINSTKDTAAKADKNHYISNSYLEGFIPIDTEYFTASGTITYTKVANIVFLMLSNESVTQKESPYTYIADLTPPPSGTLYQDCIDSQGIIFRITLNSNGLGIQYTGDSPPYFYGIIAYTL